VTDPLVPTRSLVPTEEALRRRMVTSVKVGAFPIVEYALDVKSCGGPDLVEKAEAVEAMLQELAQEMRP
jgi:hypothetical protein